eukprot:2679537-Prorocentrum_lima.AAC.1
MKEKRRKCHPSTFFLRCWIAMLQEEASENDSNLREFQSHLQSYKNRVDQLELEARSREQLVDTHPQ